MIGLTWYRITPRHGKSENHAANDIAAGRVFLSGQPGTLAPLPFGHGLSTYCPTTRSSVSDIENPASRDYRCCQHQSAPVAQLDRATDF